MRKQRKNIQNVKDKTTKQKKEKNVESLDNLVSMLNEHRRNLKLSEGKIRRLRDLLSRNSALKLTELKREKMKKQLVEAEEDFSFSQLAIDQISFRISQLS